MLTAVVVLPEPPFGLWIARIIGAAQLCADLIQERKLSGGRGGGARGHRERGSDDEALRRGSDVPKRITGDQRQGGIARRVEQRDVLRMDDVGPLQVIVEHSVVRRHADLVVGIDVAQLAEERVAMPREAYVAILARQRRARDVPDRQAQRPRVAAGADYRGDAEARDLDAADRRARRRRATPRRRGGAAGRYLSAKNRVELLIFERLVELRFDVRVKEVPEADDTDEDEQPFEPAADARRAAARGRDVRVAVPFDPSQPI